MLNLSQYLKDQTELVEPIYLISLWHQTATERYFLNRKIVKVQSRNYSHNLYL